MNKCVLSCHKKLENGNVCSFRPTDCLIDWWSLVHMQVINTRFLLCYVWSVTVTMQWLTTAAVESETHHHQHSSCRGLQMENSGIVLEEVSYTYTVCTDSFYFHHTITFLFSPVADVCHLM